MAEIQHAALPFCEDSVKARRFAGTRDTGEDNPTIARQFQTNILQVVLPSSAECEWYFDCSGWGWWDDDRLSSVGWASEMSAR